VKLFNSPQFACVCEVLSESDLGIWNMRACYFLTAAVLSDTIYTYVHVHICVHVCVCTHVCVYVHAHICCSTSNDICTSSPERKKATRLIATMKSGMSPETVRAASLSIPAALKYVTRMMPGSATAETLSFHAFWKRTLLPSASLLSGNCSRTAGDDDISPLESRVVGAATCLMAN